MKWFYSFVYCMLLTSLTLAWHLSHISTPYTSKKLTLFMKKEKNNDKNYTRKIKRNLKTATPETFGTIFKSEFEEFVKHSARGRLYHTLVKKIRKRANKLKIDLNNVNFLQIQPRPTILKFLQDDMSNYSMMLSLIQVTNMTEFMNSTITTLLLPSNDIFQQQLAPGSYEAIQNNPSYAMKLVQQHVLNSTYVMKKLIGLNNQMIPTYADKELQVKLNEQDENNKEIRFVCEEMHCTIVNADFKCVNGLIHVVDRVLLPEGLPTPLILTNETNQNNDNNQQIDENIDKTNDTTNEELSNNQETQEISQQ